MRILTEKAALKAALAICKRTAGRGSSMPILASALVSVDADGELSVTATDLEVGCRILLPGGMTPDGSAPDGGGFCVNAKLLAEVVGKLPDASVSFELEAECSETVTLTSGPARLELAVEPAEEYPSVPSFDFDGEGVSVPVETVTELAAVIHAASKDETRYNLNGVYAETVGEQIRWTATDGHRLAQAESFGRWCGEAGMILPRGFALELQKLSKPRRPLAPDWYFAAEGNSVFARLGPVTLVSRLIEGKYPNYAQVIPETNYRVAHVDAGALADTLARVAKVAPERSNAVKVSIDGELVATAKSPDTGSAREALEVDYSGEAFEVGVNGRYMADALEAVGEDRVALRFAGGTQEIQKKGAAVGVKETVSSAAVSPVLIDAPGSAVRCVVMPLRL